MTALFIAVYMLMTGNIGGDRSGYADGSDLVYELQSDPEVRVSFIELRSDAGSTTYQVKSFVDGKAYLGELNVDVGHSVPHIGRVSMDDAVAWAEDQGIQLRRVDLPEEG
jgi:hypothetical protein